MSITNNPIDEVITAIIDDIRKGYPEPFLPCDRDERISTLVKLFINGTNLDRRHIWQSVDWHLSGAVTGFAERMASLAVREKSRERIVEGLVALIIEDYFCDWRDNLRRVAPLYDAAKKIGLDPNALFLEVAGQFKSSVAVSLRQFTERSPQDQSLEAFAYSESADADGFIYKNDLVLDKELFRKMGINLD